ncbi:MMPL family transporter [candidate division KSB3 bacterium]|uniref:MMPL family transporter n=1 Tax=candidate division KSB3 bacterium TaxID=2044937 RepID=A0A9D5Q6J9_9BACT|nr:MMPL family transporter [candidate division KSB3 bacterium]MBD3324991.1 MMPL family transporter [candidate division KSB3 bacterium]
MKVSRFSVHRPIFTIMIMLIILILGIVSLSRLPIDLMPDITYPTLAVFTSYENASPEEIEQLISRPLEEAMSAVAGVEEVTSSSMEGRSTLRLSFAWGTDLDAAANDIRDRLDRVIGRLPDDAERPTLGKFDPAAFPILIMGASSNLDLLEMRRIIDDQVKYRIERIPGVAALDLWGGREREIQVNFLAEEINALGLSLDQVIDKIRTSNRNAPGGSLERGNLEVTVRTAGEFTSLEQLRNTVVAVREGSPIRLSEIATVEDTSSRVTRIIRINGKPGIYVAVTKQSGTNTVRVAREVLRELERINQDIPQINLTPIIDTSSYIENAITNVGASAVYGGILAVFVLLFFLRNIPSTVIIATAIPISIVATFALIYFGGFTLNIMTLGGLALGVGMMVDSSIVVLENIHRLRETGLEGKYAAIDGSEEVTSAIIAGTLTTLAVFLPLIFVRGMAGIMFKQLAYVVSFALICALFVALTLVPTLSARLHTRGRFGNNDNNKHRLYKASEKIFQSVEESYKHLLDVALNHRVLFILGAVLLIGGSLLLIPLVGVEFLPAADEGEVRVTAEMETGTRLEVLDAQLQKIEAIVTQAVPEAEVMLSTVGSSRWGGGKSGNLRVRLTPLSGRSRSSEEVAADLRRQLTNIPGVQIRTRAGQGLFLLRMGSGGGEERIQLEIRGYDLQTADTLVEQLQEMLKTVEGITDVRLSRESGNPEDLILIDRPKAADMKLTVSQIATMLRTVMRGTVATYYRERGDEFPIRVQLKDAEKMELRELLDLTITNSAGEPVVLRNVVNVASQTGPTRIERKNQERITTISANISGRDMGHIVADIRERLQALPVPRDFSIVFGGDVEEQRKAFQELLLSLILALLLVYMVMASLYESLRDPFVVMFSVPLAIIGVVLMLFLTDTTFNVQSFIGCIMLGGIVVNNAILLVDHINLLRRRDGLALREAIEEAGRRRLRPILMTSTTTMLALTPLAIGLGEGAETQAPLARAVIGGLFSSTLITLVFIPVIYSIFEASLKKKSSHA